jgi:hypothetical protein
VSLAVLRKLIDPLVRRLFRNGIRQGLAQGSSIWLAVALVAGVIRLMTRPEEPRVIREELRAGETIVVTHRPGPLSPTRRERRRARRVTQV